MAYDFSTLNDKEFEKLCRDILNSKFGLDLQDFKSGQDQGVDLRFCSESNLNAIVVQVKHYLRSGYKQLLYELKNTERANVTGLKPNRYMIVTSVPLSNNYKNQIFALFHPFMQTPNDIFGQEDLNKYLEADPELEKKWYKLWLSSTNVLQTVLHNAVLGRSAFAEQKIRKTIRLYSHSQSYDDAFDILSKHKYILITGQPGVGKTTLANFLTYHLLSEGHQLIYIDSDVKDAEELFANDNKVKQVFYFDDFLGANYLEMINPRTSESAFVNFLERIKSMENKYLILTTRTTIFRTALERYEKMKRIKVDIARKEIELGKYSELDKAKILYNHLYHSGLNQGHKDEILAKKQYWKIIAHQNYNPRLIEFITDPNNSSDVPDGKFMEFVSNNLEYPEEVWRHAYEQQLTVEEKILLHIVYTQKANTQFDESKLFFTDMLNYEVRTYNHQPTANPFQTACKKLLDGILKKEVTISSKTENVSFINPSINDFLNNYFLNNDEVRWKLIKGTTYIEQFEQLKQYFFNYNSSKLKFLQEESSRFAEFILDTFDEIKSLHSPTADIRLRACDLLCGLFSLNESSSARTDSRILQVMAGYKIADMNNATRKHYLSLMMYAVPNGPLEKHVTDNWDEIILKLIETAEDESEYEEVLGVFEEYGTSFADFVCNDLVYSKVKTYLKDYIEYQTESWVSDDKENVFCLEDWESSKYDVKSKRTEFLDKFFITDDFFKEEAFYKEEKLGDIIEQNNQYAASEAANQKLVNKQLKDDIATDFEKEIEELFMGIYNPEDPYLISARGPQF